MTEKDTPILEFPCANFPIKVLGMAAEDYLEVVYELVAKHCPECPRDRIKVQNSGKGSFQSLTLYITAQSPEHLERIHQELKAHHYVRMVI